MINSQRTLVAYLDILGYREIIENETPEEFYESIARTFNDMQVLIDSLSTNEIQSNAPPTTNQSIAELVETMGFKILSDTIIIYWDLDDMERINKQYYEKINNEFIGTTLFFTMVSSFILLFIARTGYLLRGGVCLGKFYTNTFDSLLDGELIFSEALVRGYELEKSGNHPRILVDETLYNLWKSKVESVSKHKSATISQVKQDKDGEFYIDIYEIIRTCTVDVKKEWLVDIIKQINNMLVAKKDDKRVWKKWYWFKEYHNEKIKSFAKSENQDLDEFLIN